MVHCLLAAVLAKLINTGLCEEEGGMKQRFDSQDYFLQFTLSKLGSHTVKHTTSYTQGPRLPSFYILYSGDAAKSLPGTLLRLCELTCF